MKTPILLTVIAVFTFAQVERGFGAIMAEWQQFSPFDSTFPVAASSTDPSITSASMPDPGATGLIGPNDPARFTLRAWNTGPSVDTSEYFEISLAIDPGFTVDFSDVKFFADVLSTSLNIHVRSSADTFASDIGSAHTLTGSFQLFTTDLSSLPAQSGTVSFRFYGTDAADGTTTRFRADNDVSVPGSGFLAVSGTATAVPEPSFYAGVSGLALLAFALCRRRLKRA